MNEWDIYHINWLAGFRNHQPYHDFKCILYPSLNHQEILGIILSNRGVEGPHRDLHMISTLNLCGKTRQVILEQNMVDFFLAFFPCCQALFQQVSFKLNITPFLFTKDLTK